MIIHQQGSNHQKLATSTEQGSNRRLHHPVWQPVCSHTSYIDGYGKLVIIGQTGGCQDVSGNIEGQTCPLVQININEGMLDPTKDKPTKLSKEHYDKKLRKAILPDETNARFRKEPVNSTTCLLTAVVYLKLKKCMFNEGTQIEAAMKFNVKTKALGQILLGKRYWGGKDRKIPQDRKNLPTKPQEEAEPKPKRKSKTAVIRSDEDWETS